MSQGNIMERGFGARSFVVVILALVAFAGVLVGIQQASAAHATATVTNTAVVGTGAEGTGGEAIDAGAPATTIARVGSIGGNAALLVTLNVAHGGAGAIVNWTASMGGLGALAGPSAISTIIGAAATTDAVTLFAQGVAGNSAISAFVEGIVAPGTVVVFVGPAASATGTIIPGAAAGSFGLGAAGSANAFPAGTLAGTGVGADYYNVVVKDSNAQNVLDGTLFQATTTLATLGGAFGTVVGNGLTAQVVLTDDTLGLAHPGGAATAHGQLTIGLNTAAAAPGAGTLTFTSVSVAPISAAVDVVAFGTAATITVAAPANDILGTAVANGGTGVNLTGTWVATVVDAAGNPVTNLANGAAAAVGIVGGVGGGTAFAFGVGAPTGAAGAYGITVSTAATTIAPGNYTAQLGTVVGITAVSSDPFDVVVGGPATAATLDVAADSVGINELVAYTWSATDGNGNPVPDGTVPGLVSNLAGIATGPSAAADGAGGGTLLAGVASGTATLTLTINGVVAQQTIAVGGVAGGDPDGITDGGEVTGISNTPIALSVTVTKGDDAFDGAIARFQATGGSVAPSDVSTGADGVAATSFQAPAGTYSVSVTIFTSGPVALIPVAGLTTTFTVVVGGGELTAGAVATFLAWTAGDTTAAAAFAGAENLTVAWRWSGSAWESYAPGAPDAVNTNYSLSNGDVLFVVSTGAVTIGG